MNRVTSARAGFVCAAFVATASTGWMIACDDASNEPVADGGTNDAFVPASDAPAPEDSATADAGLACGDATGAPARVLALQSNGPKSELAVVRVADGQVDGRFEIASGYGTTSARGSDPYLLAGETDEVFRLDAKEPWKSLGSWNVRGDDTNLRGDMNANPVAVAQVSCEKAYVVRYNRNKIAIIDPSRPGKGAAPTGWIDLASFVHADDKDGNVEPTAAIHVPSQKRVYVLLGNTNLNKTVKVGFSTYLICSDAHPEIIAIDTDTDKVVAIGGSGPGGGVVLGGYNPPLGAPFWYDAATSRFVVLSAGCNTPAGDGGPGPGPIALRRVEEASFATPASPSVKTLVSLDTYFFPSSMAYFDATRAAVGFYGQTFFWDPRTTALGPELVPGTDIVTTLGASSASTLLGARSVYVPDDAGPLEVVAAPYTDGGADAGQSVIASDPFTSRGGYFSSVESWPAK